MPTKVLQLVAIGGVNGSTLKDLEEPIRTQLSAAFSATRGALPAPTYAFNKDRNQYHSNAIMRRLVPLLEPEAVVLGVVDVDLFEPDSAFIFGQADRESRTAVLSTFRLKQNADTTTFLRRLQVEGIQLAGHLVGLSYCEDARCAMFSAQTPQEVDKKQPSLCHVCRNELVKLNR